MIDFIVIIPARLQSYRLKEKLIQTVNNKPLLYWTYKNAIASGAKQVFIATDSQIIVNIMSKLGANCILTSKNHNSGTSRIAEAIYKQNINNDEIIVNLQGDEPMLSAKIIKQVANNLYNNKTNCATLCKQIESEQQYFNTNYVKVVFDKFNKALYFSRSPIPYFRDDKIDLELCYKHIGIYAYRADFINKLLQIKSSKYEVAEKLEQLTIIDQGYVIHIEKACDKVGVGVDTKEDLEQLRKIFNDN